MLLLTLLMLSASPLLVFAAEDAENQDEDAEKPSNPNPARAWILLRIANRTAARVERLIERIYANESLIETLSNAGLLDDLEGNVTLFEEAKSLLGEAYVAIESGEYEEAVEKITDAMSTFRAVFKAIHRILEDYVGDLGPRLIARGLLVAMRRALERVAWIRRLAPEDQEINSLLDEAEVYLNITAAEEMLLEGNVTGVAQNLVKANRLISEAFRLLREKARMGIKVRMSRYLENMRRSYRRMLAKLELAKRMGANVSKILERLGYENETQLTDALMDMLAEARSRLDDIRDAMKDLQRIGRDISRMNRALTGHKPRGMAGKTRSRGRPGQGGGP